MRASKAKRLRALIEGLSDHLEDEEAVEAPELFPQWKGEGEYREGQRVCYGGILYRCLMYHLAQPGWDPVSAPSLWARVLIEDPDVIPEWVQPGSTNPYMKGDRVQYKGSVWESVISDNLWEPGVYGWEIVA